MQNALSQCATHLREVEEKLSALLNSPVGNPDERSRVTAALGFIRAARTTVSHSAVETESDVRIQMFFAHCDKLRSDAQAMRSCNRAVMRK
jgi:hypothetical protein